MILLIILNKKTLLIKELWFYLQVDGLSLDGNRHEMSDWYRVYKEINNMKPMNDRMKSNLNGFYSDKTYESQ